MPINMFTTIADMNGYQRKQTGSWERASLGRGCSHLQTRQALWSLDADLARKFCTASFAVSSLPSSTQNWTQIDKHPSPPTIMLLTSSLCAQIVSQSSVSANHAFHRHQRWARRSSSPRISTRSITQRAVLSPYLLNSPNLSRSSC